MASRAFLKAFSRAFNAELDLVCSDGTTLSYESFLKTADDMPGSRVLFVPERTKIEKLLSVFTGQMNRYSGFVKKLLHDNHHDYTHVVFDHNGIAGCLVNFAKAYHLDVITIHHNVETEYYRDNATFFENLLFLHHVRRNERRAYKKSDYNLYLTRQDLNTFKCRYGSTSAINDVLGVVEFKKIKEINSINLSSPVPTFAITGTLCTRQGVDGILYFFRELYKFLPQPCKIIVAGSSPAQEVVRACKQHENVELIANPDDMNAVLCSADAYICPTRLGGGLKLRVMDGLRLGLPVLTHSCSARGYDLFSDSGYFLVFENPKEFKTQIELLYRIISQKDFKKECVWDKYCSIFSFEAGLNRLTDILQISATGTADPI